MTEVRFLDTSNVLKKMQKIDVEVASGRRKLIPLSDILKKYKHAAKGVV